MDTNIAATANLDMTLLTEEIYQAVPREVLVSSCGKTDPS